MKDCQLPIFFYNCIIMKNWYIIILIILGILVAFALFSGFFVSVPKFFRSSSEQTEKFDSSQTWKQQRQRIQDIKDQQRQMMDQQEQRVRDMQRR